MHLRYLTPAPELIPDVHGFFDEQIHQLQWHGYSEEDIEWNCERNTIEKLQAKIADSAHYFEIVRDSDVHNRIIGYFESNAAWKEQEKQFIQWIFVHSEYTGKWIARHMFDHFHSFCIQKGYKHIGSCTETVNIVSQRMHETFWYSIQKIDGNTIYYQKEVL